MSVGTLRSLWIVTFVTQNAAFKIFLRDFDWNLCMIFIFDFVAVTQSWIPYIYIGLITVLNTSILFSVDILE